MHSEVEAHIAAVLALYEPLIGRGSALRGSAKLWGQFQSAAATCHGGVTPQAISALIERVNELVVARLLLTDPGREGELHYDPAIIPDGRRIDFVVVGASENTYVEVKTVNPQAKDSESGWHNYLTRRGRHLEDTHYIVEKKWMGAQLYGNSFSARSHFLDYAQEFETRLAAATAVRAGRGILAFCGTGWAWHLSELEDFADFYLTGRHRFDDPFGRMEAHGVETNNIELLRNISAFAFVKRGVDRVKPSRCVMPVRGPRFPASFHGGDDATSGTGSPVYAATGAD
jgi:hypothetical protein